MLTMQRNRLDIRNENDLRLNFTNVEPENATLAAIRRAWGSHRRDLTKHWSILFLYRKVKYFVKPNLFT